MELEEEFGEEAVVTVVRSVVKDPWTSPEVVGGEDLPLQLFPMSMRVSNPI